MHITFANDLLNHCDQTQGSFLDEIINEGNRQAGFRLDKFLTSEEIELLRPEYDDGTKVIFDKRNPKKLRRIFEKILVYIQSNDDQLKLDYWEDQDTSFLDHFEFALNELIKFCNRAEAGNKEIHWYFTH